jgi:myo-inositol-1(or 4)-monophosphatase
LSRERRTAEQAALAAGEVLARLYRSEGQARVEVKGLPRDLVTEADREAEAAALAVIRAAFPQDAVVAEESSPKAAARGRAWIVDPLDGTVNFAHGIPIFSVSVGFAVDGEPRAGAVHAPLLRETFSAAAGEGATRNGEPVRVSAQGDLGLSLLATGFAYRRNEVKENNLDNFARLALGTRGVRRFGSAALDLAGVACGRFDGYWEMWLSPWDVCAGIVLVREAGGTVTGIQGRKDPVFGGTILATNGRIHAALDATLTGIPPERSE